MNTHEKLSILEKKGVKIYPVISLTKPYKFAVRVEDLYNYFYKKKKTTGEYKHTTATINKALESTLNYIIK